MPIRIDNAKEWLTPQLRVAGRIVAEDEEIFTVRMGGYLLEIPRASVASQEKDSEDAVILTLNPDADILMTMVTPVEEMIGVLSSKIVRGRVNPFDECCDCTECSYCTDCTECSDCTTLPLNWGIRAMRLLGQNRSWQPRRLNRPLR